VREDYVTRRPSISWRLKALATALSLSVSSGCGSDGPGSIPVECPTPPCDFQSERLFTLGDDDRGIVGAGATVARIGPYYYVADQDSRNTIQVFHPDSGFVGSIGQAGQGPEEFQRINDLGADSAGSLWVLDIGNARIALVRTSGARPEFLGTFRLPPGVQQRFRDGMTVTADGTTLLNSQAYVNGKLVGPSTYLIDRDEVKWAIEDDSLGAPGAPSRQVYALDGEDGYWTAALEGTYRLEHRRLSDGGLVSSFEPRRPWHDEHPESVRLPPRAGDPPGPDGEPPSRTLQAARIHDIHVRGDQLWVIGSFDNLTNSVVDVFDANSGELLYERGFPSTVGYFIGFDDDGLIVEYEGGDRPRLHFWKATLDP
jgi:hypothetical protein